MTQFDQFLAQMKLVHDQKARDYDKTGQYMNHRKNAELGIPAWKSPLGRANEKWQRIRSHCQGTGRLVNDKFEDELVDIANLVGIAWILWKAEEG